MFTLNCKGKLISLEKPLVMGIINATPDSFYEGHLNKGMDGILKLAGKMIQEGADILDIGGQSSRPGSERIFREEEMKRVIPVIELISKNFKEVILSVDTYDSHIAQKAVEAGAYIINDISAGQMDKDMIPMAGSLKVPYICMHMKGTPENMQKHIHYEDVVKEVLDFFIQKLAECKSAGINDVIIDPGFGFGKAAEHNFTLLKYLSVFEMLDRPILAGLSRKSTIYKTLHTSAENALNGTTVMNTLAVLNGASILRVHDVKEAREVVSLMEAYKKTGN